MRIRRLHLKLFLAMAGTAVALGYAELMVWGMGWDPLLRNQALLGRTANRSDCLRPAPHTSYELVPGACGANSLGLMDDEVEVDKPPGTFRVLVLGDSIAEQRIWVDLLEDLLGESSGRPVEVWNLGLSGYGTLNELEQLRHRALGWDPDLVLLQFCLNDYEYTPLLIRYQGRLYRMAAEVDAMGPVTLWLFEHSVLVRMVLLHAVQPQAHVGQSATNRDRVDAALGEMRDLCDAAGVPFSVLVFPEWASGGDRNPDFTQAHERVLASTARLGIPTLDLEQALAPRDLDELTLSRGAEMYEDLEGALARWNSDPRQAYRLRALPESSLNLAWHDVPGAPRDRIHPSFLGHWLVAEASAAWVAPEIAAVRPAGGAR